MTMAKAKMHMKKSAEHAKKAHECMNGDMKPDAKKGKMEAKDAKGKGGMEAMKKGAKY